MDYYLGEIRIFTFSTMPSGWMPCNGQSLPIQTNQALYSLLGTHFGGNATTNFNLPNLNGTVIVGTGIAAKTGTVYELGNAGAGGAESVKITTQTMPAHTHYAVGANESYNNYFPNSNILGNPNTQAPGSPVKNSSTVNVYGTATNLIASAANTLTNTGDGAAHENRQPYMPLMYCISINGIYPPRPY